MVIRLLFSIWALFFKVITAEFHPKVTRTKIGPFLDLLIFDDSNTLLKFQEETLYVSSDNGVNWEKSDEINGDIWRVDLDEHYRSSRAVAVVGNELYLTEDRGKHWRNLRLPKVTEDGDWELDTHPLEKDHLLARCITYSDDNDESRWDSYVSKDGGRSFRKIEPRDSKYLGVSCEFACKSRDSIFSSNKDLVYCLGFYDEFQSRRDLFYTEDFGESFKFINQFKDHTVSGLQILDSHILVHTLEDKFNEWSPTNLWVSNDGFTFNKAFLPTVLREQDTWCITEDELGRIITTYPFWCREASFISDSSGLQFHLLDISTEGTLSSYSLTAPKTLKGTMWAKLESNMMDPFRQFSSPSKISFDYGDTWSNLRVIRSPDQPNDLFPCDVDDVENCSLKLFSFYDDEYSQTGDILMTVGTVGKDRSSHDEVMTFISRDGGRSWEVALEYPCSWAFGDGGNIVVAMPISQEYNVLQDELYYSLDQGKTWKTYQLEVPIRPWQIISTNSDGSGLDFIIIGASLDERLLYTVDFTGVFNGRVCGPEDFEHWYLAGGECLNGAKYSYRRRKQDSQCLVHKPPEELSPREEPCDQCTRKDYECSFGFIEDINGVCKPDPNAIGHLPECKDPDKSSIKLKPMNKLPGNKCLKEMKIEPVKVPCNVAGQIFTAENKFKFKTQLYQYFDTKIRQILGFFHRCR